MLVDSGSTDRTREIAAAAGARVVVNAPWPGFVAQRDFAVRAARHDWVIALDADERVGRGAARGDPAAARETGFSYAGYRIPRVALYLGRWIRGTDWYPDWQVRLFDRTRAGWQGDLVHESVSVRGPVGPPARRPRAPPLRRHLRPPAQDRLLHHAVGAPGARRGPPHEHRSTCRPGAAWAFFRNYVLKRGFLLGGAGFIVSVLNTHYTFAKLAKLRELERNARVRA